MKIGMHLQSKRECIGIQHNMNAKMTSWVASKNSLLCLSWIIRLR